MGKFPAPWAGRLFADIKRAMSLSHEESAPILSSIASELEEKRVHRHDLCASTGNIRENHYLWDVMFLRLGECHDPDVCPNKSNPERAAKFYLQSKQPPAMWRCARLCLSGHVRPSDLKLTRSPREMIRRAICALTSDDDDHEPLSILAKYFDVRLRYLVDMIKDLSMEEDKDMYVQILQWILRHKDLLRVDHEELLVALLEHDFILEYPEEERLREEVALLL